MLDDDANRSGRDDRRSRVLWVIAAGFAVLVAVSGVAPTGTRWFDLLLLVVGGAMLVRVAAAGPWWARTGAAGLGAALALNPIGAAFGVVGLIVGALTPDATPISSAGSGGSLGSRNIVQQLQSVLGGQSDLVGVIVAGCALNALARMDVGNDSGLSTLIGCLVSIGLLFFARDRFNRFSRRRAQKIVIAIGVYVLVAAAMAGLAGLGVRDDAKSATASARAGATALEAGDETEAAEFIDETAAGLRRVERGLDGPLTMPARLVPGLAQNIGAARSLVGAGARLTAEVGNALDEVDIDGLSITNGAIDLDAFEDARDPVDRVDGSYRRFVDALEKSQSPWLVPPFRSRLAEFDERLSGRSAQIDSVLDSVDLLPQILGRTAPRRYLVLLTTPAEARGLGGFPGSWATIEVTDGRVEVGEVARIEDLNAATQLADCSDCDAEMLQRYGRFGLTTAPGGLSGPDTWSNLTIPASFPAVADAAVRLYVQATDSEIDGVIVMDPFVMETLASYGDPIELTALTEPIPTDGVADFILADQYELPGGQVARLVALAELSTAAIEGLLSGSLPEPAALLSDIGPLVEERRLLFWTTDPAEQRFLDGLGLLGDFPALDPEDGGFSMATTNGAANKIDRFISRDTVVTEVLRDGDRYLRAEVTLRNDAPQSGLPQYVIGNEVGLPDGSHRLIIALFGPSEPVTTTLDGVAQPIGALPEDGWIATEVFADFAPGQERTIVVEYSLPGNGSGSFAPTLWEQPTATRNSEK